MTASDAATLPKHEAAPGDTRFLGHPLGLAYLAFTEAFERFSFYGMQSLLILYLVDQLLHPGHIEHVLGFGVFQNVLAHMYGRATGEPLGSHIVGFYTSFVYVTPLLGGYLGDRYLGRRMAVAMGAVLMAIGHFTMAFESAFVPAILFLISGCGLLKGNIASQVGGLYSGTDPRRADAFQMFTLAVNAGVIAAPLICGYLGARYGYNYGFGAAGVGMLIALCIYLSGYRYLPQDVREERKKTPSAPLTARDWRTIAALVAILPILSVAFVGNNQIYNAYMIWARESADLTFGGFQMPVTWLQSYDAGVSVLGILAAIWFWQYMARRNFAPHELFKLALGCGISIFGFLILALATAIATGGTKAPLALLLLFHIVNTAGFVNILPVALALFTRAAPPSVNAMMIGVYYLLFFVTNTLVGWIGGLYPDMSHVTFWLLHAGMCAGSTASLLLLYKPLKAAL